MKLLEEKILSDGIALNDHVLKVDSFLNHQVDVNLMEKIGIEFADYFKLKNIDKVVTIESSGIAPAFATASKLNVPLVILKKQHSSILNDNLYETTVHSFTKNIDYTLTCSKKFLNENENILLIDDFLANGEAVLGAKRLFEMSKSNLIGVGIVIEKSFQPGREKLNVEGIDVYSLAQIEKLDKNYIQFKK
jgi:xanthine phosphoribosyltransferase